MLNVTMMVRDRPRLTQQAIESLIRNTDVEFNCTIVDDGSGPETEAMLKYFAQRKNFAVLRVENGPHITGLCRNLVIWYAEKRWGRGDWLVLSDNDVFFAPNWAFRVSHALYVSERHKWGFQLAGGQNHPYHHPTGTNWIHADTKQECYELREYSALAGTSWLMRWETWDRYGPLEANAPGIRQSEDHAFCQRIRNDGGKVGAVWPHAVIDCSVTDTYGKPVIGIEAKQKVEGAYYE